MQRAPQEAGLVLFAMVSVSDKLLGIAFKNVADACKNVHQSTVSVISSHPFFLKVCTIIIISSS